MASFEQAIGHAPSLAVESGVVVLGMLGSGLSEAAADAILWRFGLGSRAAALQPRAILPQ